jgi:hypothetical protein
LDTKQDKKNFKIGTFITIEERDGLVALLQEYTDVFPWTYTNMHGLDIHIVVHHIPLMEENVSRCVA